MFRRRWSPAARSRCRDRFRSLRWSRCSTCRGLERPERWIPTRTRGCGGGVDGDEGAPVMNVGQDPAHENQWVVGNVHVSSIGWNHAGLREFDGDRCGGGEEECRRASGRHCDALKSQWMGRIASGWWCGAAARAREEVKALGWPVHGDQEVAAGGSLGLPWRARVRPGRERKEVETGRGWHVGGYASKRWSSGRGIGGERRWQERRREGSGACQRKTKQGVLGGLVRNFQRVQGPLCKLKFSHCYKGQMEKCSTWKL
jgi:hypothetical protein